MSAITKLDVARRTLPANRWPSYRRLNNHDYRVNIAGAPSDRDRVLTRVAIMHKIARHSRHNGG